MTDILEETVTLTIDGQPVEFSTETVGLDTYTVIAAPSGQHKLEIVKGRPLAKVVAPEHSSAASTEANATGSRPPTPNNAPNRVLPPRAGNSDQAQTSLTGSAGDSLSPRVIHTPSPVISQTRQSRESWLSFIQIMSTVLVVFTCLAMVGLVAIKRVGALKVQRSRLQQHPLQGRPAPGVMEFRTGQGDHRSPR